MPQLLYQSRRERGRQSENAKKKAEGSGMKKKHSGQLWATLNEHGGSYKK